MSKDVKWEAKPYTLAKIEIVKEYLKPWIAILGNKQRIVYIDGFSGPGEYASGEKGSPIAALETALNHKGLEKIYEFIFLFIEEDENKLEHLKSIIKKYNLPNNIKVELIHSQFEDTLNKILDYIEDEGKMLAPTFLFIDPFGIKGVHLSTIQRYMSHRKCEFLLTYMIERIYRFKTHQYFEAHLNKLYDSDDWKYCLKKSNGPQAYECLVEKFEEKLSQVANYQWRFNMIDQRNKHIYSLYFCTNHIKGLEKMKDAMWKIEPTGSYEFRSRKYGQLSLFDKSLNINLLIDDLIEIFSGKTVYIEEIENAVIAKTDFRKAHIKQTLRSMEHNNQIFIDENTRFKRLSYPPGTLITFLE